MDPCAGTEIRVIELQRGSEVARVQIALNYRIADHLAPLFPSTRR